MTTEASEIEQRRRQRGRQWRGFYSCFVWPGIGYAMVLFKDRRQAVPAMEKLEKWGVVSRPVAAPAIGHVLASSPTAEIDRIDLGNP